MKNFRVLVLCILFSPAFCIADGLTGQWRASYPSVNGDGFFEEYIIILKSAEKVEALRWETATCTSCNTKADRQTRINKIPTSYKSRDSLQLLKAMELVRQGGELVALEWSPIGEDVEFYRNDNFKMKPSFNCAVAKQPREQAICASQSLSLLDLELSFTFAAAKGCSPKANLDKLQGVWWKDELSKCQSGECVPAVYSERIGTLRKYCK
jgi:hypothetical protein